MDSRKSLVNAFVLSSCNGFSIDRSDQIDPSENDTDSIWTSWYMIAINFLSLVVIVVSLSICCCFKSSDSIKQESYSDPQPEVKEENKEETDKTIEGIDVSSNENEPVQNTPAIDNKAFEQSECTLEKEADRISQESFKESKESDANELEMIPGFFKCLNPHCNFGQILDNPEDTNLVTCYECGTKSCYTCKSLWHEGIKCKDFKGDEQLTKSNPEKDEEMERRRTEETTYECTICVRDDLLLEEMLPATNCNHDEEICLTCFDAYITAEMRNRGNISDIKCPHTECEKTFSGKDIFEFAKGETVDKFSNLALIKELGNMSDFRWCKAEGCGFGQLHEDKHNPIVTCIKCKAKSCFAHDVPWHYGKSCEEFTKEVGDSDLSFKEWSDQNAKKCPKCGVPCEKDDGCDHVKCRCGFEFCWTCLADFDVIRKNDNTFHDKACRFHADNLKMDLATEKLMKSMGVNMNLQNRLLSRNRIQS